MKACFVIVSMFLMVSCASSSKKHVCKGESCHPKEEIESVFSHDIPDFMGRG